MDILRSLIGAVVGFFLFSPLLSSAEGLTFALVTKSVDDANFIAAAAGCARAAARNGDECLHVGPAGAAHFRAQDRAIRQLLTREVDGIALSVTNGEYLARKSLRQVADLDIPLITFDSDMPADFQSLRRAYVGPDNVDIGRQLASLVLRYQREGTLCLMSASPFDTNLNQRLQGVRDQLAGPLLLETPDLLKGENGWTETGRCPWYNADDESRAVTQVFTAYTYEHSDAIVSVGAWPLIDHDRIEKALWPFRAQLQSGEKVFILATGTLQQADYDLMDEGLIQGFVSIDFEAMGEASYRVMKAIHDGENVEEYWRTPVRQVTPESVASEHEAAALAH